VTGCGKIHVGTANAPVTADADNLPGQKLARLGEVFRFRGIINPPAKNSRYGAVNARI